jgi:enediyne biosynthesis protein E4
VRSGSSYLSASELAVTLGLGQLQQADRVTVRWPSGTVDELRDLAAGKEYGVREGAGVIRSVALPGHESS